jgi:hypothetical protein
MRFIKPNSLSSNWQLFYYFIPGFIAKRICAAKGHEVGPVCNWFYECSRCKANDIGVKGLKIDYDSFRDYF